MLCDRRVRTPALLLALLAALACGPAARASAPCDSAPVAGREAVELAVDGAERTALVHVGAAIAAGRPVPLVLALHGYGGSGPRMERYSGFSELADRYGFVVAYPSSLGLDWDSTAARDHPRDVRFLAALIDSLERTMCIDPNRVFATGVSNGGSMVALAGCELSSRIAAIAPVAGDYSRQPPCRPSRPVSVLEIHGTADQVVPYFGRGARPTADGMPRFVDGWVRRDRCASEVHTARVAPRATWYHWARCAGGARVEHIRIAGGRHQWPGATPPDPGPPSTFCGACTIWRFFSELATTRRSWGAVP